MHTGMVGVQMVTEYLMDEGIDQADMESNIETQE
jgi:hypothetical protein